MSVREQKKLKDYYKEEVRMEKRHLLHNISADADNVLGWVIVER